MYAAILSSVDAVNGKANKDRRASIDPFAGTVSITIYPFSLLQVQRCTTTGPGAPCRHRGAFRVHVQPGVHALY